MAAHFLNFFFLIFLEDIMKCLNRWMDDLPFSVLFNSISVISDHASVCSGNPFTVEKISNF